MSMFDSNDFLKLIQEGKISPDTITRDFTDALNAALAAKKQADEAAGGEDATLNKQADNAEKAAVTKQIRDAGGKMKEIREATAKVEVEARAK